MRRGTHRDGVDGNGNENGGGRGKAGKGRMLETDRKEY